MNGLHVYFKEGQGGGRTGAAGGFGTIFAGRGIGGAGVGVQTGRTRGGAALVRPVGTGGAGARRARRTGGRRVRGG